MLALALAALVAALLPVGAASAAKPDKPPKPVDDTVASKIVFAEILDADTTLPSTPGSAQLWYVIQDQLFDVDLAFTNADGELRPLSTSRTVTVTLLDGATTLGSVDVEPGSRTASILGLVRANAQANLRLTAVADTKPTAITATSKPFDVLSESRAVSGSVTSIGGGPVGQPCVPAPGTVCGDLMPPVGQSFGTNGLLSQGVCDSSCPHSYVQALVETAATNANPATLVMKCDKEVCGGGAIQRQKLTVTLSPGVQGPDPRAADYTAPSCPDKNVVSFDALAPISTSNLPFCVDYVQSTRDNAGNTILYLLFVEDAKVRFS